MTQATNVSLVYTIDAYRPVAGEIVVTQLGFKGDSPLALNSTQANEHQRLLDSCCPSTQTRGSQDPATQTHLALWQASALQFYLCGSPSTFSEKEFALQLKSGQS